MIINVTNLQFPGKSIKRIKALVDPLPPNIQIVLNIGPDANSAINDANLDEFMVALNQKIVGTSFSIYITEGSLENLSAQSVITLLNNQDFSSKLYNYDFIKLIVSDEAVTTHVLQSEPLKKLLNGIEPEIDSQIFENSCFARSTLVAMRELGLIVPEECTRSKELEIYREVWIQPGKITDPKKIIQFFEKNKLLVVGMELTPKVEHFCRISEGFKAQYQEYVNGILPHQQRRQFASLEDSDFPEGKSVLIIIDRGDGQGTHTIFGKKTQDGFEIMDPFDGNTEEFGSIQEFMTRSEEFLGIFFDISLPQPVSEVDEDKVSQASLESLEKLSIGDTSSDDASDSSQDFSPSSSHSGP